MIHNKKYHPTPEKGNDTLNQVYLGSYDNTDYYILIKEKFSYLKEVYISGYKLGVLMEWSGDSDLMRAVKKEARMVEKYYAII
jgi:hypothetical protein